jgi:putative ABC transport system ATP-binding protein
VTDLAVELTGVEHAYARTVALRGVSLAVSPGEVVAVTGPSGCGKSTLLHVASGVVRAQAGRVRLLGADLAAMDEAGRSRLRRRTVGIILQFGQLVPDLPVLDNVALPLLLEGHEAKAARTAALGWLERVGLPGLGEVVPAELSGGQAQRAALARALIAGPEVIFADEPTASMDGIGAQELLDVLLEWTRERGAALIVVTHNNLVAACADRELRLRDGAVEHEVTLR